MSSPAVVDSVLATIGRTPVVRLRRLVPTTSADVFVKVEHFTPTGSYKDLMALAMIAGAERRGTLRPGMRVIEFAGGSTGSWVEGTSSGRVPPHLTTSDYDEARAIDEDEARAMARRMAKEEGISPAPRRASSTWPAICFPALRSRVARR